jgi:hypothetical protein
VSHEHLELRSLSSGEQITGFDKPCIACQLVSSYWPPFNSSRLVSSWRVSLVIRPWVLLAFLQPCHSAIHHQRMTWKLTKHQRIATTLNFSWAALNKNIVYTVFALSNFYVVPNATINLHGRYIEDSVYPYIPVVGQSVLVPQSFQTCCVTNTSLPLVMLTNTLENSNTTAQS